MSTALSPKHKAIALVADQKLDVIEVPTKFPAAGEVSIEVDFASYGAADGHAVDGSFYVYAFPQILGFVAVGKVLQVGDGVTHVKPGDTAGVFTQPDADRAIQEIIVAPANRISKVPEGVSPAEVAAIIDNFVTAWWTLSDSLELPLPTKLPSGSTESTVDTAVASMPIVIWGAGTGAAQYMIQLLRHFGFTNIIVTASPRSSARAFMLGATHVVDYNDPNVAEQIVMVAGSSDPIKHAVDTVSTKRSMRELSKIVTEPGSRVALLIPFKVDNDNDQHINQADSSKFLRELPQELNPFDIGVEIVPTATFTWESNETLKEKLLISIFPELLRLGKVKSQPIRLLKSGSLLERVKEAARLTKNNELGGEKAIIVMRS